MPRYWLLCLTGVLYVVFAFSTHAVMAAPLAAPDLIAHATLQHPKRGIASARYLARNPAKLAALGASWSYDWSATPPPQARGLEWVPMIWGPGSRSARRPRRSRPTAGWPGSCPWRAAAI